MNNNEENINRFALNDPEVTIMLCTYQGEKYIWKQLESIKNQTHKNLKVIVSDDGSIDSTVDLIQEYIKLNPDLEIKISYGPREGVAKNFLSQIWECKNNSEYYCFSDQDDIWESDKIERAIRYLNRVKQKTPALYCSRTKLIDERDQEIGYSCLYIEPPGFKNAIVQNIGGGNTMVMNVGAMRLLKKTPRNSQIILHDWWTYMLITGVEGYVFYDEQYSVKYRQHKDNQVGANTKLTARINRMWLLINGEFKKWNSGNLTALQEIQYCLTDKNRKLINNLLNARSESIFKRLYYIYKCGVHRQTLMGNLGLVVAAVLNKL